MKTKQELFVDMITQAKLHAKCGIGLYKYTRWHIAFNNNSNLMICLAIEVYLKAIYLWEKETPYKYKPGDGHDIASIFKSIDLKSQIFIKEDYERQLLEPNPHRSSLDHAIALGKISEPNRDFLLELKSASKIIVQSRYIYEGLKYPGGNYIGLVLEAIENFIETHTIKNVKLENLNWSSFNSVSLANVS